ncbi:aspartate/methionine/tyrosine aminotransferase [Cupriavidus metallidurans]|jgi:aspartate/methionine/tyrosine aminotransferase|uniref:Aminotransferase n=1 Tax=Cupriavidus metallidurans (strain ATCC 43123 / DSM 2839 / NBRC 102507 / CH34) TaxID=266264 RepID=Q1LJV7_CUPMC|nr:pyridoxal phosphate-dependent aminotransferase [Cupriavidus metallidurans]ABF09569.1 aspartate/tyrosine/aromatic aminotransferase [Cupriavidus metallidurans CH34]AVA36734.1 pyridoxal phosphate-dependent aminotransferase [Cupriavidus metallidurans]KWW37274.1 putative N-acetyl-LL-diaminopimelate aminotransferase [Cupriavidus metallidurans]MDE4919127.1 pyridoxal phosphate-dependent aminotransferase [Cupriavidus metallidurans]QGS29581.1 pyridoxal phosphate-dependent aminotransferase [Cupriavidu
MDLQRLATASRLANIDAFHVMELAKQAAELERAGRHIIHMGIGEPDFTAAAPVIHAAEAAMRRGVTQYTGALGIHALREAIAGYYKTSYGIDVPARRVIVTAGASGALLLACAVLVEIGAEVLMPDPSYPCNRHFVAAFDGHAKMIPSGPEERFQLTAAQVIEHWGENTRGVLLASPSNPTGTSILPDELKAILAEVRKRQGFAILDEIYQGLSYDAPPVSALSLDDNVVTVNSFSKYFNMTGWRLGWLVVPDSLVPAFEKVAQNLFICASAVAQHAALACFTPEALAIYDERKAEFRRRRDAIVPALEALGLRVPVKPDGAFYVYANCRHVNHPAAGNADRLTQAILHDAGVVMVPGTDFGPHTANDYIRISYATSMQNIEEAMQRLHHFLR